MELSVDRKSLLYPMLTLVFQMPELVLLISAPTYVTAWPGGQARPLTSNLNPVPGMAVPNLAIVRLGSAGDVNFFNNSGSVTLLADVVGYFRGGTTVGLEPLVPARLLDM